MLLLVTVRNQPFGERSACRIENMILQMDIFEVKEGKIGMKVDQR
jgi:hypothetical protein